MHAIASSPNEWGMVIFATLVPLGVIIIGGLLHVVYRTGKLTQQVEQLRSDVSKLWSFPHQPTGKQVQHHERLP